MEIICKKKNFDASQKSKIEKGNIIDNTKAFVLALSTS